MYSVGDLFAGIGGVAKGFEQAGMHIKWANEIDKRACTTYRANFNHLLIEEDINNLNPQNLEAIDILCGGFPCQAFSIAGYRKGFNDTRGNLFFEILRFVEALRPKAIFLENVKNLMSHDKGNTFKVIKESLEKHDYYLHSSVLNTCEYSEIPQNRERVYLVAFKNKGAYERFKYPEKTTKKMNIRGMLEDEVSETFYYKHSKIFSQLENVIKNRDTIYQWRRIYVRENKSGVCPTLTANMGTGGHNVPLILDEKGIRKLTPRECLRFQGFSDDFIIPKTLPNSAIYKQAGNSVSIPVIKAIAENIRVALDGS